MTWKQVFTSAVGRKLVMGLTGIFLICFLMVHAGLNACIWAFDGGEMFNKAAHFMGDFWVIRLLELGLFAGIFIHIIQGLILEFSNRSKRGEEKYAVNYGNKGSKWYSRSMGLLGTILLLFLILHWTHFWVPARLGIGAEIPELTYEGMGGEIHNMFVLMQVTFSQLWIVIVYVVGCISLAYHLAHGFQSAFLTMGVYNNKYMKMIKCIGYAYAIIVPLIFALMPITMYLGHIGIIDFSMLAK